MLDNFHGENDVEVFAAFGQRFGRRGAVIDGEPGLRRMALRRRDVLFRRVGADHRCAEPRQRLGQNPAAAADVEDAQARKAVETLGVAAEARRGVVADVGEAHRIELVQHRHGAMRVPPVLGEPGKLRNLRIVDGAACVCHGRPMRLRRWF